ncbi:hypothetical protein GCM10009651_22840 [Microbacterium natoriense]
MDLGPEGRVGPVGLLDGHDVEGVRHRGGRRQGHSVQVGQRRPFGGIRLDVAGHREDAGGLGVVQPLEPHVLLGCDGGDVLLDVRVDALVDERHACGVADEHEFGQGDDGDVHGDAPFYAQAEPEHGLCAERTPVSSRLRRADAVHGAERPAERLDRAVAVSNRDVQDVRRPADKFRGGERHAPAPDVLRQGHSGERREHPAQVVLGGSLRAGEPGDVDLGRGIPLHEIDQCVECSDHRVLLSCPASLPAAGSHPIVPVRSDHARTGPRARCAFLVREAP